MLKKVLNVGGQSKTIALPAYFGGWEHVLLDIDPAANPDVVCDARKLDSLPAAQYDAVYCSHNLEHYHRHEVKSVLEGFRHVLKPSGFVWVRVPDMGEVMQIASEQELDIEDVLYHTPDGIGITVHDVIYGLGSEIEKSGNDFFAHKAGFTAKSLTKALLAGRFPFVYVGQSGLEIHGFGFISEPDSQTRTQLGLG